MHTGPGRIAKIQMDAAGHTSAWIECSALLHPQPGQYLVAQSATAFNSALATILFPGDYAPGRFLAAAPIPENWQPGIDLELRGPHGHGFHLPSQARRLVLAALGETPARLLPLVTQALSQQAAVALFFDGDLPALPSSLEAAPLEELPGALAWADFIAVDLPVEQHTGLSGRLGLSSGERLPCPGQALVMIPIPCAGLGACGACAVKTRLGWRLVCQDGPVFDLHELI